MATDRTRSSSAKKSSTKKSSAKKSSPRTSSESGSGSSSGSSSGRSGRSAPRAESRPASGALEIAQEAARQLLELTGKDSEGVTGLERTDDGWTVQVEVVEVRRIPDTTDVLALYDVDTDERGNMQGYRRVRRYARGSASEDRA
jgi:hypothetical protein